MPVCRLSARLVRLAVRCRDYMSCSPPAPQYRTRTQVRGSDGAISRSERLNTRSCPASGGFRSIVKHRRFFAAQPYRFPRDFFEVLRPFSKLRRHISCHLAVDERALIGPRRRHFGGRNSAPLAVLRRRRKAFFLIHLEPRARRRYMIRERCLISAFPMRTSIPSVTRLR
jgi:hypothetical protein